MLLDSFLFATRKTRPFDLTKTAQRLQGIGFSVLIQCAPADTVYSGSDLDRTPPHRSSSTAADGPPQVLGGLSVLGTDRDVRSNVPAAKSASRGTIRDALVA